MTREQELEEALRLAKADSKWLRNAWEIEIKRNNKLEERVRVAEAVRTQNSLLLETSAALISEVGTLRARVAKLNELSAKTDAPIPMRLTCPECKTLHVDEGEFATKVHHTHSCQSCGLTWRPAVVPTVGVRFLPGFKSS